MIDRVECNLVLRSPKQTEGVTEFVTDRTSSVSLQPETKSLTEIVLIMTVDFLIKFKDIIITYKYILLNPWYSTCNFTLKGDEVYKAT